jgi:hypothetical protein
LPLTPQQLLLLLLLQLVHPPASLLLHPHQVLPQRL